MTVSETTLSALNAASTPILFDRAFNVWLTPSSDWSGELRIQASPTQAGPWTDEVTESGGVDWGGESGRFVGDEVNKVPGVWYRASVPAYTSGSITVRFDQ